MSRTIRSMVSCQVACRFFSVSADASCWTAIGEGTAAGEGAGACTDTGTGLAADGGGEGGGTPAATAVAPAWLQSARGWLSRKIEACWRAACCPAAVEAETRRTAA